MDRGFYKGSHTIPDNYQSKVEKIEPSTVLNIMTDKVIKLPHKIFISHSSKDQKYVKAFVELLEDIGMPEGTIICTSVPGYGIPGGKKIYEWLREQFLKNDLRVIYMLSENYYSSPASLNEMGAAWLAKTEDTLVVLPRFSFAEIKGCVDSNKIGIDLGGDKEELKSRLNEFKDELIDEFNLSSIGSSKWERHRNDFIRKIDELAGEENGD